MDKKKEDKKDVKNNGKTLTGEPASTIEIDPQDKTRMGVNEAASDTAVIAWGRMNPPTIGHEKLIKKVMQVSRSKRAMPHIYVTHTQDKSKNPLTHRDKVDLLKKVAGSAVVNSNARTIIDAMKELAKMGHKKVVIVAGSDRVGEYSTLLNKYNGKDYSFESIEVVSAGQRDPDAEGAEGMSATKMRTAAKDNDSAKFKSGLPSALKSLAPEIMDMVRAGLQVKEELDAINAELSEAVLSLSQRRKKAMVMRRYKNKIKVARERAKRKMASREKLTARSRRAAVKILRKRVAGQKGAAYASLSASDKAQIDKRVQQKKALIGKIAQRLLPKVRKAELTRLRNSHQKNTKKEDLDLRFEKFLMLDEVSKGVSIEAKKKLESKAKMAQNGESQNSTTQSNQETKSRKSLLDKTFHQHYGDKHLYSTEQVELTNKELFEVVDLFLNEMSGLDRAIDGLKKKALKTGFSESVLEKIFEDAIVAWYDNPKPNCTPEQYAYQAINTFVANEGKDGGLWDNIHKKRARIKAGSGEKMRKPGSKGAPTAQDFKNASEDIDETKAAPKGFHFTKDGKLKRGDADTDGPGGAKLRADPLDKFRRKIPTVSESNYEYALAKYPAQVDSEDDDGDWAIGDPPRPITLDDKPDNDSKEIAKHDKALDRERKADVGVNENFMDGKGPGKPGDAARHGLTDKSNAELKKIRSSDTASPRKKQLAHWMLNFTRNKKKDEQVKESVNEAFESLFGGIWATPAPTVTQIDNDPWRKGNLYKHHHSVEEGMEKGHCGCNPEPIEEAEYQGKTVNLNDPIRTSEVPSKKFKVYVKDGDKVKVVRFGDPNLSIKRDDPERRKSFRARHNCENPGPKTSARYWSCFQWRAGAKVDN